MEKWETTERSGENSGRSQLRLIRFFHLSRRTTVIQDLLVRRQFSRVPVKR
jgi:hypothetical protein